jgi:hypothetical protein
LADVVRRSTAQQNPAKSERHGFFFFRDSAFQNQDESKNN